jgi:DNA polymerase I-like protein with 3'-5' exonuclease and polymerase domains
LRKQLAKKEAVMDDYLLNQLKGCSEKLAAAANAANQRRADEPVAAAAAATPPGAVVASAAFKMKPARPGPRTKQAMLLTKGKAAAGSSRSAPEQQQQQQQQLQDVGSYTLLDLYEDYWKPFGEVLTNMESEGVCVNR